MVGFGGGHAMGAKSCVAFTGFGVSGAVAA